MNEADVTFNEGSPVQSRVVLRIQYISDPVARVRSQFYSQQSCFNTRCLGTGRSAPQVPRECRGVQNGIMMSRHTQATETLSQ